MVLGGAVVFPLLAAMVSAQVCGLTVEGKAANTVGKQQTKKRKLLIAVKSTP